jgi:Tfp pilus assembly protein PilX
MATAESRIHKPHAHEPPVPAQRGAVLIVGLVILLVITLLGITGQQHTVLQERMAGNMRQDNIALQAAEAALTAGLAYVDEEDAPIVGTNSGTAFVWTGCTVADSSAESTGTPAASESTNDPCARLEAVLTDWESAAPDKVSQGVSYEEVAAKTDAKFSKGIPDVVAQPRVYIEVRSDAESPDGQQNSFGQGIIYYYTVSAVGFGANEKARVILQSTVAREY